MFNNISREEWLLLKDAIPMITVLIAGADGEIDEKEKWWAGKLTHIRSYSYHEVLQNYYREINEDFETRLERLVSVAPSGTEERTSFLSEKLAGINLIMAKLENEVGHRLYESFLSFADHVAKASGGFLRFATVSKEEKKLLSLSMIEPIEYEED